jgi:hypothetical protein
VPMIGWALPVAAFTACTVSNAVSPAKPLTATSAATLIARREPRGVGPLRAGGRAACGDDAGPLGGGHAWGADIGQLVFVVVVGAAAGVAAVAVLVEAFTLAVLIAVLAAVPVVPVVATVATVAVVATVATGAFVVAAVAEAACDAWIVM